MELPNLLINKKKWKNNCHSHRSSEVGKIHKGKTNSNDNGAIVLFSFFATN